MRARAALPFLGIGLCAVILLGVGTTASRRSLPVQQASLRFAGFTNLTTHGDRAVLYCTNSSAKSICFLVENFDTEVPGGWETHRLDMAGGKGNYTEEAHRWLLGFVGSPHRLGPHESARFYVPFPATNTPWRVRFLCVEQTLPDRIRRRTVGGIELPADAVLIDGEFFTGRRYELLSPAIRGSASPSRAR
jgi:hypothetical protein